MARSEIEVTVRISDLELFRELIESIFMSAYLAGRQNVPCLQAKREVEKEVQEYLNKENACVKK